MDKIRIVLADDHNVLRQGMAQALESQPDMLVVGQASNGLEALALAQEHRPDVILMDINMPELDGVEAARQIAASVPESGIIMLTMYLRDEYVFEAIKAGASGYLLKEAELEELLAAVRSVARGEAVLDPAITGRVLAELRTPAETTGEDAAPLSDRDTEILRLVAQGMSNQEIARQLHLADKTIRNRLTHVFRQLNLENRTQAALYAIRNGLLD